MSRVLGFVKSVGGKISLGFLLAGVLAQGAMAQVADITPITFYQGGISNILNTVVNVILWVAGILAVIYLIWGGLTYVTAGGDAEKAGKGRVAITNAIIGIVIIAAALAIYNAVLGGIFSGITGVQNS
jgi:hypothetical protein